MQVIRCYCFQTFKELISKFVPLFFGSAKVEVIFKLPNISFNYFYLFERFFPAIFSRTIPVFFGSAKVKVFIYQPNFSLKIFYFKRM
jgi:hypothetical protein